MIFLRLPSTAALLYCSERSEQKIVHHLETPKEDDPDAPPPSRSCFLASIAATLLAWLSSLTCFRCDCAWYLLYSGTILGTVLRPLLGARSVSFEAEREAASSNTWYHKPPDVAHNTEWNEVAHTESRCDYNLVQRTGTIVLTARVLSQKHRVWNSSGRSVCAV